MTDRDFLLWLIYADHLRALDRVRWGRDRDAEFVAHEARVAPLRRLVAELDRLTDQPNTRQKVDHEAG